MLHGTNDLYAPKYVEALGGVIFSESVRQEKITEEEKALYKQWDALYYETPEMGR